jgi:hypothetical protein
MQFPTSDERLDFVPGRWAYNDTYLVKTVGEDGRINEMHKPVITYQAFHLCSVALKPYKFGMINSKIKVKVRPNVETNVTQVIDLPIVGYVSPDAYPLRSYSGYVRKENVFKPRDVPFSIGFNDLGEYNIQDKKDVPQTFYKPSWTHAFEYNQTEYYIKIEDIYLSNTFTKPITELSCPYIEFINPTEVNGVVHQNLFREQNMVMKMGHSLTAIEMHERQFIPSTYIPFGSPIFHWRPNVKHTQNGHQYFGVVANFTHFPMYAQVTDNRLICTIIEDYQPLKYQDCFSGVHIDFGQVGYYQSKSREILVTNPFNEEINIVGVYKVQKYDDVIVYHTGTYESIFVATPLSKKYDDERSNIMKQLVPKFDNVENPESFKKTHGKIELRPGETLKLLFVVDGASILSEKKAKKKNTFEVMFNTMPLQVKNFKVSYSYTPV